MGWRKVRLFFCALLIMILAANGRGKRHAVLAAAPLVEQPIAAIATRSYYVAGAPPIRNWPTVESVFYRYGAALPSALPASDSPAPAYVEPAFELVMLRLRPAILASASRHNRPAVTGISDEEFGVLLAAQLYFEYNSALASRGAVLKAVTPLYQEAQDVANHLGLGNFSVWPANLRPSVAASLLRGEMPYIDPDNEPAFELHPISIHGSKLQAEMVARRAENWQPSLRAVALEISQPELAIEYMAANFEIASYRAEFDWAPVTWMTFAAWHNQGVVSPASIAGNGQLAQVLPGVARYIPAAMRLISMPPQPQPALIRQPLAR